jgi:hypothetical protein
MQMSFIHKLITFNKWIFRMFCDSYVQFSMPRNQGRGSKRENRPRFGFSSLRSIMYSLFFPLFISSTPQSTKSTHIVIVQKPHSYASTANFLSLSSNKQSSSNAHISIPNSEENPRTERTGHSPTPHPPPLSARTKYYAQPIHPRWKCRCRVRPRSGGS